MTAYSIPRLVIATVLLGCAGVSGAQSYSSNSSYANPPAETTNAARTRGPCGDPWVTLALERVYGRAEASKCTTSLYNGGRWSDFNALVHAVAKAKGSSGGSAAAPKTVTLTAIKYGCATPQNCTIYSNEGDKVGKLAIGQFQAELASNLVNAGGLNLVGKDGAKLIGNDGAGLVAAGAGNLISQMVNMNPPATPKSGYALAGVSDFKGLKERSSHK